MSWKYARVWDDISVLCIPENVLLSHERLTSSCVITEWWDREGGVSRMNQSRDWLAGCWSGDWLLLFWALQWRSVWLWCPFLSSGCPLLAGPPRLQWTWHPLFAVLGRVGHKWKGCSKEVITSITKSSFCVPLNVTWCVAVVCCCCFCFFSCQTPYGLSLKGWWLHN